MASLGDIRLITLDLDDTLWPIVPVIERAERLLHEHLAEHAPGVVEKFTPHCLRGLRAEVEELHPELGNDITALRKRSIALALERSGEPGHHADAAFEVFWNARNEVDLFPDAAPALERLSRHFSLAAVSNGNADVTLMPMGHYFDFSLSARQAGVMKPDPGIFHRACETAGVRPGQVLHVGDDLHCDVQGALDAGLQAAWIHRPELAMPSTSPVEQKPAGALLFHSLRQLADALLGADNGRALTTS
ncbi:MAG: HAD-IA family hydrolase [Gammaproteobacteria bacterium]|nr:HAD-IA family hydrolase [Gammaproteobacteria bacterium]